MKGYACFVSAACLLACVSTAAAGPAVDAAAKAEALVAEGKPAEALDALDAAYEALWNFMPLGFRNVHLVESSAGYGIYEEQKGNSFRADDRMAVYVEPVGYSYAETPNGYSIDLKTSLEIRDTDGKVVAEAKDLWTGALETRRRNREFNMTLSYIVPFMRPGDYVAVFQVRDGNSEKTGSFEVPFTMLPPV
jgi:hypothetical protein